MGQFFDTVCCIDETKFNSYVSDEEEEYKDYKSKEIPKNKIYNNHNYSNNNIEKNINSIQIKNYEIKKLNLQKIDSKKIDYNPLNEIQFKNNDNNNFIRTLSTLPIDSINFIRQKTGKIEDDYLFIKNLGQGGYGKVIKASHKKTGMIRAIKFIPKNNLKFGYTDEDIFREIEILRKLQHPNIMKLYEFYSDNEYYYLVNEYCSEGDLNDKMIKIENFDENVVKILMFQIFQAVYYLHNKNVIHGDLKLENIMIDNINTKTLEEKKINKFKKNLRHLNSIKTNPKKSFN